MLPISSAIYFWFGAYILLLAGFVFSRSRSSSRQREFVNYLSLLSFTLFAFGYLLELLSIQALSIACIGLMLATVSTHNRPLSTACRYLLLSLLALALATHQIPGFDNARVFQSASFGRSELPFTLYANLDKSIAALLLLLAFGAKERWNISPLALKWLGLSVFGFYGLALGFGAEFELKLSELTVAFLVLNLFTTCVAEEAFFRLVVQNTLERTARHFNLWLGWPILITALVFALAHFHTFEGYELRLSFIFAAGLLYALAYRRFNLGVAVALHFLVNAVHFIFFAYPATFS